MFFNKVLAGFFILFTLLFPASLVFYLESIWGIAVNFAFLITIYFWWKTERKFPSFECYQPFLKAVIYWFVIAFLVTSLFHTLDLFKWKFELYYQSLFLVLLILLVSKKGIVQKHILNILFLGLSLAVISAIYLSPNYTHRLYDIVVQSNAFGVIMAMSLVIVIAIVVAQRINVLSFKEILLYCFFFLVFMAGLFYSGSRGAWLSFVIGYIFLIFLAPRDNRFFLILMFLVLGLLLYLTVGDYIYRKFDAGSSNIEAFLNGNPNTSWGYRLEMWILSWEIFKEHFWTGVGFGRFHEFYALYAEQKNLSGYTNFGQSHNNYFNIIVELGIWGGISLFLLVYFLIKAFKPFLNNQYGIAAMSAVMVLMVFMLTDSALNHKKSIFFILYVLSVLYILAKKQSQFELNKKS